MSKTFSGYFFKAGLKPGDKVKILSTELFFDGVEVDKVYTLSNYCGEPTLPGSRRQQWNGNNMKHTKVEEMQYEDDWVPVTKGVTVPEDADTVKSEAGHVVAFRPVKKPKVVACVEKFEGRYLGRMPAEYFSQDSTDDQKTLKGKFETLLKDL